MSWCLLGTGSTLRLTAVSHRAVCELAVKIESEIWTYATEPTHAPAPPQETTKNICQYCTEQPFRTKMCHRHRVNYTRRATACRSNDGRDALSQRKCPLAAAARGGVGVTMAAHDLAGSSRLRTCRRASRIWPLSTRLRGLRFAAPRAPCACEQPPLPHGAAPPPHGAARGLARAQRPRS